MYYTVYCNFSVQLIASVLYSLLLVWCTVDCECTVQSVANSPNNLHDLNVIMLYSELQIPCTIMCI